MEVAERAVHAVRVVQAKPGIPTSPTSVDLLINGTPIERECVTRRLSDGALISRTTFRGRAATIAALLEVYERLINVTNKPVCKIVFNCAHAKVHMTIEESLPPVTQLPT